MSDIEYPLPGAGTFSAMVIDPGGSPSTVLDASTDFTVECEIVITAGNIVTGDMTVAVFADELGGPIDKRIGQNTLAVPGDGTYPLTVTVPALTLPEDPPPGSGIYRFAAVLTHVNGSGIPTELTAFEDLGTFRVS